MAATAARAGSSVSGGLIPYMRMAGRKRPAVFFAGLRTGRNGKGRPRQGTSLLSADSAAVVLRVRRVAVVPLHGRGEPYSPSSSSSGSRMLV